MSKASHGVEQLHRPLVVCALLVAVLSLGLAAPPKRPDNPAPPSSSSSSSTKRTPTPDELKARYTALGLGLGAGIAASLLRHDDDPASPWEPGDGAPPWPPGPPSTRPPVKHSHQARPPRPAS